MPYFLSLLVASDWLYVNDVNDMPLCVSKHFILCGTYVHLAMVPNLLKNYIPRQGIELIEI